MRFKRSDWPGILLAAIVPPLLMLLFLQSFQVWHHRGTPLLGTMATVFGVGIGVLAMFTRFVRNWDLPMALGGLLLALIGLVIWLQRLGYDHTPLITVLKWLAVLAFLAAGGAIVVQVLTNGFIPILDRRNRRTPPSP